MSMRRVTSHLCYSNYKHSFSLFHLYKQNDPIAKQSHQIPWPPLNSQMCIHIHNEQFMHCNYTAAILIGDHCKLALLSISIHVTLHVRMLSAWSDHAVNACLEASASRFFTLPTFNVSVTCICEFVRYQFILFTDAQKAICVKVPSCV